MKALTAAKKGMITAILMVGLSVIFFYGFDLPVNGKNQYVILLVSIAGVLWSLFSLRLKGAENGFRDFFSEGFRTFIIIALFMAVFTFIFYKLNPQILENGIKENNELILKEGNRTPAEIEANANKMRNIFMPMMLALNTFKYLLLGAFVTLVGAGFLSRKV